MSTTIWTIDPAHTGIIFKVKHLMITNVTGLFREFNGKVTTEGDDFSKAEVQFAAKTASVDTANPQRDTHLVSDDFFKSDKFPEMQFQSTRVEQTGPDTYKITGGLRILDITKEISFPVQSLGLAKDPYGNTKAGFSFSTVINRKDFGLTWNVPLETGGILVSEEVWIQSEIQLVRQS